MDFTQILLWLTPFIIWGVTELVKKLKPLIPGWVLVTIVVPLLSIIASVAQNYVTNSNVLAQFLLGLLAVFLAELIKQFKQK